MQRNSFQHGPLDFGSAVGALCVPTDLEKTDIRVCGPLHDANKERSQNRVAHLAGKLRKSQFSPRSSASPRRYRVLSNWIGSVDTRFSSPPKRGDFESQSRRVIDFLKTTRGEFPARNYGRYPAQVLLPGSAP